MEHEKSKFWIHKGFKQETQHVVFEEQVLCFILVISFSNFSLFYFQNKLLTWQL